VRCAPHVIGVLLDALAFARQAVEIELNSVNDNPIVDPETGAVLHGGNFYGGHVAFAMDGLKSAVAASPICSTARCSSVRARDERRAAREPHAERRRQSRLQGDGHLDVGAHRRGAQAHDAAASFSRSTESHNQDKVSMGTIAARDCRRILELSETVAAILLLADCQALELRGDAAGRARAARDRAQGVPVARSRPPPGPRHRVRARALPRGRAAHRRVLG
jgi:histidine ammonia-lyase